MLSMFSLGFFDFVFDLLDKVFQFVQLFERLQFAKTLIFVAVWFLRCHWRIPRLISMPMRRI